GARVTLASTEDGPIQGSRGASVVPDCLLADVDADEFDLVILPGGLPGTTHLQNDKRVLDLVRTMNGARKIIGAICAAPTVLQTAGIIQNKMVTSHPSVKDKLNGVRYSEDRVVVDGNIVTSRSPGTAMEFAMNLVEILFDGERVSVVNGGVMARL
ncbi:MAG: DJ-1 family glyoxalase III, partial [Nitrospinales bacterium]